MNKTEDLVVITCMHFLYLDMSFVMPLTLIADDTSHNWLYLTLAGMTALSFIAYRMFRLAEGIYAEYLVPKPFLRHWTFGLKSLSDSQRSILRSEFTFYRRLNLREQKFFEHRVAQFIRSHSFIAKGQLEITTQMEVLIAATAVMLTFGYRNYTISSVERFLIYPDTFYSTTNKTYHKGEFNLGYKAIVFSWKDFLHGYDIANDNFNLGIHEYVHAMHFEFLRTRRHNVSAAIFLNALNALNEFLQQNPSYQNRLVASQYLRDYAYTNSYEFTAVMIESFIETPKEFRANFPEMYDYVKKMLNFNFAGY